MPLAKWQEAKLNKALIMLKKGPSFSYIDTGKVESVEQMFKLWAETWVIPLIEDTLQGSELNPHYRK